MDHVAIMNKKWGMIPKIQNGQKTIESRWYKTKRCPFGQVKLGDYIYYKNSGEPVVLRTRVKQIEQFEELNPEEVSKLLEQYYKELGIGSQQKQSYFNLFKNKKYCLLIFLDKPEKTEPFDIDKTKAGYCSRAAWISTEDINIIKKEAV